MISYNCYSACANDELIRINKFISRFQTSYVISFFISIRTPLLNKISNITLKNFSLLIKPKLFYEWMEYLTSPQGCGPTSCLHRFGLLEHWLESPHPKCHHHFPLIGIVAGSTTTIPTVWFDGFPLSQP
jgi:hypothetical protein